MSLTTRMAKNCSIPALLWARCLALVVPLSHTGCASSPPPAPEGADDVKSDQVKEPGAAEAAVGDDQLEGDDYLVQVKPGEYKAAKFDGGGPPRGLATFTMVGGGSLRSAAYYRTRLAGGADIGQGVVACFFRGNRAGEIYGKPTSKDGARSGAWGCRPISDTSEHGSGYVHIGGDKVAVDNLRVERREGGSLE